MTSDESGFVDAPVFVTGLMKTGSTLLLALFDGHPDLLVYPDEPSFERLFARSYQDAGALARDFLFGTPNPLHFNRFVQAEHFDPLGFDPRDFSAAPRVEALDLVDREALASAIELRGVRGDAHSFDARAYHRALAEELDALTSIDRKGAVVAAARALAAGTRPSGRPPRRWLFKQPLAEFRESSFEWFFGQFPRGSAVVIVRDPRAYVTSLLDYVERQTGGRSRLSRSAYFFRRLASLEEDYLGFASAIDRYGERRVRLVRYEDLIADTEAAMRDLAGFVGVPFDDALLTPTKAGAPVRVPTATAASADRVYGDSVDRYRRDLGRARIALVEAAIHRALGSDACPYAREASPRVSASLHGPVRAAAALAERIRPMRRPGAPQ